MDALERINKDQELDLYCKHTRVSELENILRSHNIDFPDDPSDSSARKFNGLDNGRRYLPYAQNGLFPEDLLLSGEDEIWLDFLTADEKVDELQTILKQREEEID